MGRSVLDTLLAVWAALDAGDSHAEIGRRLELSRSRVTNLARLRALPAPVQAAMRGGALTPKHAEALLGLPSARAIELWGAALRGRWSVERLRRTARSADAPTTDPDVKALEEKLGAWLATDVRLRPTGDGGGHLVIRYPDTDCLDGILTRIGYAAE
jgi:ParB family chromosome partitioning protein